MKGESYFKNILVPVDGSHQCLHAEELAAVIAKKFKSKVRVIHVVSHEFMLSKMRLDYQVPYPVLTKITNWFMQRGRKILWEAEAHAWNS